MEQKASCGTASVDILVEDNKIYTLGFEASGDIQQVRHRAGQTVETCDHQHIALTDKIKCVCELLTHCSCGATLLFTEEFFAACPGEAFNLNIEALAGR